MTFGPQGALVGALAGLAVFGYTKLVDWVDEYAKKEMEKITEEIKNQLNAADAALKAGDVAGAQAAVDRAAAVGQGVATEEQAAKIAATALEVTKAQQEQGNETTGALGNAAREALTEQFELEKDFSKGASDDQQQLAFKYMKIMVDEGLAENLEIARKDLLGGHSQLSKAVKKNIEKLEKNYLELHSTDTPLPPKEPITTLAPTPQAQDQQAQGKDTTVDLVKEDNTKN